MDPLSLTASIIAVVQLASTALGCLSSVHDAPAECTAFDIEISNLCTLLNRLRVRANTDSDTSWYQEASQLAAVNGALDQLKTMLNLLVQKMETGSKLKKVGQALVWKWKKEEITVILGRMERLKRLISVALEMDHL